MGITGQYIDVNGIKVYYETNGGPRERGTIFCLHTAGRDSRQYHGIMEYFADNYEVVAADMPGHGKSWPLPGLKVIDQWPAYGQFYWDIVTALGIERPVIMGCSLGGYMTYYMAQNYPIRAAIAMQGLDYRGGRHTTMADLLDHPYINVQFSHFEFSESLIGPKTTEERKEFILWGVRQETSTCKKADLGMLYDHFDLRSTQEKVTCPVMIVRGTSDWGVPDAECRAIAKRLVNASKVEYLELPGYGHFIAVEAPELLGAAVEKFLSDIE